MSKEKAFLLALKELDEAANRETRLKSDLDKMKVTLRQHEDFVLSTEMENRRAQNDWEAAYLQEEEARGVGGQDHGCELQHREDGEGAEGSVLQGLQVPG